MAVCTSFTHDSRGLFLECLKNFFGPEKPFLNLQSAYSRKLVFYYDFKIRKSKFVAKFHAWKRPPFFLRYVGKYPKIWHSKGARKVSGVRETHAARGFGYTVSGADLIQVYWYFLS